MYIEPPASMTASVSTSATLRRKWKCYPAPRKDMSISPRSSNAMSHSRVAWGLLTILGLVCLLLQRHSRRGSPDAWHKITATWGKRFEELQPEDKSPLRRLWHSDLNGRRIDFPTCIDFRPCHPSRKYPPIECDPRIYVSPFSHICFDCASLSDRSEIKYHLVTLIQ